MNKERKARFDDVVAQLEEAKDTLSDICLLYTSDAADEL